jgi:hypothetical protein
MAEAPRHQDGRAAADLGERERHVRRVIAEREGAPAAASEAQLHREGQGGGADTGRGELG